MVKSLKVLPSEPRSSINLDPSSQSSCIEPQQYYSLKSGSQDLQTYDYVTSVKAPSAQILPS